MRVALVDYCSARHQPNQDRQAVFIAMPSCTCYSYLFRSPSFLAAHVHESGFVSYCHLLLSTVLPPASIIKTTMAADGATRSGSPSDERTPLLQPKAAQDDEKPLPRDQLFLLCLARLVEPVAFFSIFPFLNQMIFEVSFEVKRMHYLS